LFRPTHPSTHITRGALFLCLAISLAALCLPSCKQESPGTGTNKAGQAVNLPATSKRVVTLAPNLTEIVYAVGGGDRLVGNTTYCDFPEQAKTVQKVGDTMQPNIERILALQPDLVLVSTASQLEAFTRQLHEHGIPVLVTDPHDLEGVLSSIRQIGSLLDRRQQSEQLVDDLRKRMIAVESAVQGRKPIRVFYQLSAEPLYTAGRDAFVTDLIKRAGGQSVTETLPEAWPRYSEESAVAARPDAIILPTGGSMGAANSDVAAGLRRAPAVINGKVIKIDGDLLVRPGPRAIDGLETLAHALHPDAFR
jgi:iron complex transport system substrate-binding protein